MFRVLNPLMRALLHLPVRRLHERLLLLSYVGRKSGTRHTVPLSYAEDVDGSLLVPGGGQWKWHLTDRQPVEIRLRGQTQSARPELVRDPREIERLLPKLVAGNPRAEQFIGVPFGPDGRAGQDKLAQAMNDGFMIVRLRLA